MTSLNGAQGSYYDPAGNIKADGVNQYLYDCESRIRAVNSNPIPGTTTITGYKTQPRSVEWSIFALALIPVLSP